MRLPSHGHTSLATQLEMANASVRRKKYRRFAWHHDLYFMQIALPLFNLLKKDCSIKLVWGAEQEKSFTTLKEILCPFLCGWTRQEKLLEHSFCKSLMADCFLLLITAVLSPKLSAIFRTRTRPVSYYRGDSQVFLLLVWY